MRDRTSSTTFEQTSVVDELLLALDRRRAQPLLRQLERELRERVRDGRLRPGTALPSTRELSRALGVSRSLATEAYAQLLAEGYLSAGQGRRTRVAGASGAGPAEAAGGLPREPAYDLRPGLPDVGAFPRRAWLAALRRSLTALPDAGLGYGDPRGAPALRAALASSLARTRGVVAEPGHIVITAGYAQAASLAVRALGVTGPVMAAVEDPSHQGGRELLEAAGARLAPVPVDDDGLDVEAVARSGATLVACAPAHQFPLGATLAPERRRQLLALARERDLLVLEDDYDAEFRYDRTPVGALQGLDPERVLYAGSVSKTLAPALRLGWLVAPPRLLDEVVRQKHLADLGSPTLDQLALADLLERGEVDRHLRRLRRRYRSRRDALVAALARWLPGVSVRGVSAGLHLLVELPGCDDERLAADAASLGVAVEPLSRHRVRPGAPGLVLGFGRLSEPAADEAVGRLARALGAPPRSI